MSVEVLPKFKPLKMRACVSVIIPGVCVCVCANCVSALRGRSCCSLSPLRGTSFGRSAGVCSVEDQSSELTLFTDPDVTRIPM